MNIYIYIYFLIFHIYVYFYLNLYLLIYLILFANIDIYIPAHEISHQPNKQINNHIQRQVKWGMIAQHTNEFPYLCGHPTKIMFLHIISVCDACSHQIVQSAKNRFGKNHCVCWEFFKPS